MTNDMALEFLAKQYPGISIETLAKTELVSGRRIFRVETPWWWTRKHAEAHIRKVMKQHGGKIL